MNTPPTTEELQQVVELAEQFTRDNLIELAKEYTEWHTTSLLPDGKMLRLAAMLNAISKGRGLSIAESMVAATATEVVSKMENIPTFKGHS